MKKIIIAVAFISCYQTVTSQEWAGPDVNICQGVGTLIGLESAPEDYCYTWSPGAGLSSTDAKQPFANPGKTTEYTVVAIGPNFSNKVVDKVKVIVYTGGVEFTPSYTEPNAQANQAHAHLTTKPAGSTIIWSIESAPLGCTINSSTGNISYCNAPGEVTVRAALASDPSCYAENKFRVNVGVKQLFAIDEDHPTRKATEGATLHLVGHNNVKLKAVPNTGESFGNDQPDWTGSTVLPPDPHAAEWTHDAGSPTILNMTAGGKTVNVERHQPATLSAGGFSHTLLNGFKAFQNWINDNTPPGGFPSTPVCKPYKGEFTHNIAYEYTNVEKLNSPELGTNHTLKGELGAVVTGKLCLPPPYTSPPNPVFVWSSYVALQGAAQLSASMSKDESKAVPAEWKAAAPITATSAIKLIFGGEVGILLPGEIFGLTGSIAGGTGAQVATTFTKDSVSIAFKVEPLFIEGGFKVWYLNPNNTMVDLKGKYNIFDPIATKPRMAIDLRNY